jgi:hypothetical protein
MNAGREKVNFRWFVRLRLRVSHSVSIFLKIRGIHKSRRNTCINDTDGKFCHSFASVVDTVGKFATGVNEPAANLPPV